MDLTLAGMMDSPQTPHLVAIAIVYLMDKMCSTNSLVPHDLSDCHYMTLVPMYRQKVCTHASSTEAWP